MYASNQLSEPNFRLKFDNTGIRFIRRWGIHKYQQDACADQQEEQQDAQSAESVSVGESEDASRDTGGMQVQYQIADDEAITPITVIICYTFHNYVSLA
jgi:hypothetical protein